MTSLSLFIFFIVKIFLGSFLPSSDRDSEGRQETGERAVWRATKVHRHTTVATARSALKPLVLFSSLLLFAQEYLRTYVINMRGRCLCNYCRYQKGETKLNQSPCVVSMEPHAGLRMWKNFGTEHKLQQLHFLQNVSGRRSELHLNIILRRRSCKTGHSSAWAVSLKIILKGEREGGGWEEDGGRAESWFSGAVRPDSWFPSQLLFLLLLILCAAFFFHLSLLAHSGFQSNVLRWQKSREPR